MVSGPRRSEGSRVWGLRSQQRDMLADVKRLSDGSGPSPTIRFGQKFTTPISNLFSPRLIADVIRACPRDARTWRSAIGRW